jgi:anthranilate synthase component 2
MLPEFEVTATTVDRGEVMALRSTARPIWGVQFHPESVLTPQGNVLLRNVLAFQR